MKGYIKGLMAAVMVVSCSAQAATRTWLSSVGGLWTSTANWSDETLPGANDTADLSATTGTINLTEDQIVGEILYNPTFSGTTNTLTILSDTAAPSSRALTLTTTATRRVQVGTGAQLLMDADLKPTGNMTKDGQGSLVIKRRLAPTLKISFYVEQGRLVNEGAVVFPGMLLRVGTIEPDAGAPAEWVMRAGSSFYSTVSTGWDILWGGNSLAASGLGSRAVVTHEGGSLSVVTNSSGGIFLNGYAPGGSCVYNFSGGAIDSSTKAFYIGFSGTGTVNQTGGRLLAKEINFSKNSAPTGGGTYNLTGGELWLGGIAQKYAGAAVFNIGGACIYPLNAGFNIYDNTSPKLTGVNGLTRFCSTGSGFTNVVSGLTGAGGFVKEGADTLNIAGSAHAFTGPVIVSNGTVNVNQAMNGGNAVLVAGGNMNLSAGVTATYSSLMVTGGVFQVASNSVLKITAGDPWLHVAGDGTVKLLAGALLPGMTGLDVSESGVIDLNAGGTAFVNRLKMNGVEQTPGLYTSANCAAITGTGTLVINGGFWTGAGGDGLWSTGTNWLTGTVPNGSQATADLSGAVSNEVPVATLVMDLAAVTENVLVLASGVAGAVLTNTCPAGVTNTLNVASEGVIYVGEGETLVMDHNLCMQGHISKRGEGTLVLRRKTYATTAGAYYLRVEAGKVINGGSMTNAFVMAGKPLRTEPGATPEFILEDTPEASFGGSSFVACMSALTTSVNPGNGVLTQNGGRVTPDIGWGTRSVIGFVNMGGVSLGGTGTYHLVSGTLRVQNTLELSRNAGSGVLSQSGGLADLDVLLIRRGEVHLAGGLLQLNSFNNGEPALCTFYMGGGRLEPKTTTTLTVASPAVFTGVNGDMTFAPVAGRAITLSAATSGTGGFVKDGEGTLTFSGTSAFSGLATVSNGTLAVSGSLAGTNDVLLLGGTFSVAAGGAARLGELAVTNGTLSLAAGVAATAERFCIGGAEWSKGVYSSNTCAQITGAGVLIVGAEPGQWTNKGGDSNWNTASNWVADIIPNGPYSVANLSAAVSNEVPVRTLVLDIAAVTNKQVIFATDVAGAALTNTCPAGVTNTLYLVSGGIIEVGEGETLVLDHDLCIMGSVFKRGLGTLILRRRTYALPVLVTSVSTIYIYVDGGKVINEGPMSNVLVSVGKLSRTDPGPIPEFIVADTPEASLSGTCFITALNANATDPGPGLFTQNGGMVNPGINWGNRIALAHTVAFVTTFATGTYNLVNGTLICSNALYFGRNSGAADGHYGIFNQSGGASDIGAIAGKWGEVSLAAGTTKVGYIDGITGAGATFYLGGGRLEPKGATPVVFRSPTVFTGINGDMTFAPASGQSVQFSVVSRSSGDGGWIKKGAGLLYLSNTNTFTGTADIQEGTCTVAVAGCLTECTNLLVGADAHLTLLRNGAALNTNLWLKVAADGKVHLDFTNEVEVGHLVLGGYEYPGRGRRYGSSSSTSSLDMVIDEFFTGTGVLKVVGPRGPDGTLISLR